MTLKTIVADARVILGGLAVTNGVGAASAATATHPTALTSAAAGSGAAGVTGAIGVLVASWWSAHKASVAAAAKKVEEQQLNELAAWAETVEKNAVAAAIAAAEKKAE